MIRAVGTTLIRVCVCIFICSCSARRVSFQIKFKSINLKKSLSGKTLIMNIHTLEKISRKSTIIVNLKMVKNEIAISVQCESLKIALHALVILLKIIII